MLVSGCVVVGMLAWVDECLDVWVTGCGYVFYLYNYVSCFVVCHGRTVHSLVPILFLHML